MLEKLQYVAIVSATILTLTACTTSEMAYEKINPAYLGESVDQFFVQNGPPYASQKLANGSTIYSWSSGRKTYSTAGTATTTGSVTPYGTYSSTTVYSPGSEIEVECQLNIVADPSGKITAVRIARDTIGDWEMSRCNEFFSQ